MKLTEENLCPMVNSRVQYLKWIEILLERYCCFGQSYDDARVSSSGSIVNRSWYGVDIGTGASCIYPILGVKLNNINNTKESGTMHSICRKKLRFLATDIDEKSIELAKQNVEANNMQTDIEIFHNNTTTGNGGRQIFFKELIDRINAINEIQDPYQVNTINQVRFSMCNPPYYCDETDKTKNTNLRFDSKSSLGQDEKQSERLCRVKMMKSTNNESITEGGELEFISQMIRESIEVELTLSTASSIKDRLSVERGSGCPNESSNCGIEWYTSLVGKKQTLQTLLKREFPKLVSDFQRRQRGAKKGVLVVSDRLRMGNTSRWVIGWRFVQEITNKDVEGREQKRNVMGSVDRFLCKCVVGRKGISTKTTSLMGKLESRVSRNNIGGVQNITDGCEYNMGGVSTIRIPTQLFLCPPRGKDEGESNYGVNGLGGCGDINRLVKSVETTISGLHSENPNAFIITGYKKSSTNEDCGTNTGNIIGVKRKKAEPVTFMEYRCVIHRVFWTRRARRQLLTQEKQSSITDSKHFINQGPHIKICDIRENSTNNGNDISDGVKLYIILRITIECQDSHHDTGKNYGTIKLQTYYNSQYHENGTEDGAIEPIGGEKSVERTLDSLQSMLTSRLKKAVLA